MEQKNNNGNVWKIVLISLGVAAVVTTGIIILVNVIKKKKKANKQIVLEWDDEEAFEKCMNGHDDCDIVVISEEN